MTSAKQWKHAWAAIRTPLRVTHYRLVLLLLDADCTTEGTESDGRAALVRGARERLPGSRRKGVVRLGLEREIILYLAGHRPQGYVSRCIGRHENVDIARVGGDLVISVACKIALVGDLAVG